MTYHREPMTSRSRRRAPAPPRPLLPTAVTVVAAIVVVAAAFLPWYAPDIAPPLAANSVSGWNATFAAKLMVVGAVVAAIAAGVLLLDSVQRMALDHTGVRALAIVGAMGMALATIMTVFRTLRIPEPADLLSRQIGLYVALAAAAIGVSAALVQLMFALSGANPRRRPVARGRRRR